MKIEENSRNGAPQHVHAREPLRFQGSIPGVSESSEYTDNYERTSEDHLASYRKNGTNPFIPENLWVQMEDSTIQLIKKYSTSGDMILDVGVGLGRLLSHFPHLQRYGIDISFGYLENAEKEGIEVCYGLTEDMPYKKGAFDIVVCTDVLEHVLNLNSCIEKRLFVLKGNGILIVRVPYRENLESYLTTPYKYVHLRKFDEYSVRLLFERIFNCEHMETTFGSYYLNEAFLKHRLPLAGLHLFLSPIIRFVKLINPRVSDVLLRKLYNPLEMNVVYRKK
jgi:SAM-dependent methyltransferase